MTSQVSHTRLRWVLATPGHRRAAGPRGRGRAAPSRVKDARAIVLALLSCESATFPRAAARWGSRLIVKRGLALPEVQLSLRR